jgi:hypothetical protein
MHDTNLAIDRFFLLYRKSFWFSKANPPDGHLLSFLVLDCGPLTNLFLFAWADTFVDRRMHEYIWWRLCLTGEDGKNRGFG